MARSFPNEIKFWNTDYLKLISSYRETKEIFDY